MDAVKFINSRSVLDEPPPLREPHPQAGKTVRLALRTLSKDTQDFQGAFYRVMDWWQNVNGTPWDESKSPLTARYAARLLGSDVPWDGNVVYGRCGHELLCVHDSEILPL